MKKFIIVSIIIISIITLLNHTDKIGDYSEVDSRIALCTPRGWEFVSDKNVLKYSIEMYKADGVYGKKLKGDGAK